MDLPTFILLLLIGFIVGAYHRDQKRQGKSGIPIYGPIIVETVCKWFEAVDKNNEEAQRLEQWLDQAVKQHESELRRSAPRRSTERSR